MRRHDWLLLIPIFLGVMALQTGHIFFKLGVPFSCCVILLLVFNKSISQYQSLLFIIAAFLFSMLGDYYLSNKSHHEMYFVYGIAAYFVAHCGYSGYALSNGRIHRSTLLVLVLIFIPYYIFLLQPAIQVSVLSISVFVYLLISIVALALAMGLHLQGAEKYYYIFGIFLIVLSDSIISFREFLDFRLLTFLILPTYYLAHISITYSLLRRYQSKPGVGNE